MDKMEETKWINYQLLILQQLEDHGQILHNLNEEVSRLRETVGINQASFVSWKEKVENNPIFTILKEQLVKTETALNSIKEATGISETETRMWKQQVNEKIASFEEDVQFIFYDDSGIEKRLQSVERTHDVQQQMRSYSKAQWALYISIIISVLNIVAHLVTPFLRN